jgi:NADH-quinone oxidoreductase subunit I
MTSGWMRATSPAGDHRYEGIVHWAGELGYGVRDPETGQSAEVDDDGGARPAASSVEHG